MLRETKREIRRKFIHTFCIILLLVILAWIGKEKTIILLFIAMIIGLITSIISRKYKIPLLSSFLCLVENKNRNFLPGYGAITMVLGSLLALIFFKENIAKAAIVILGFGDSVSLIIGREFGGIKFPWNSNKHIEGNLAGAMISTIVCLIYVNLIPAIIASLIAMFFESFKIKYLDDNISIPIIAGIILTVFTML